MAVKFGFKAKASAKPKTRGPRAGSRLTFGDEDGAEGEEQANDTVTPIDKLSLNHEKRSSLRHDEQGESKPTSKAKGTDGRFENLSSQMVAAKNAKEAVELDPTIYDYDAAFDAIHARDAIKKAAAKAAAAEGKSRYMDGLLASAEARKRDQLQARERLLQREREAEGEDFADKEQFVTGAYKAQQEEVKRLEEEEKRKEEAEEKKRKTMGMTGFYKHVMDEQEKRYQEITTAAAEAEKNGLPTDTGESATKSAVDLAKEINAQGGHVVMNEDGQVVDRRELLSAGLNVVAKPIHTPTVFAQKSSSTAGAWQGRNAGQKSMRERQTRMLESQLEQAAKRAADDEAEQQRAMEHKAKSQKTDSDISSARERFLQRKRDAATASQKT